MTVARLIDELRFRDEDGSWFQMPVLVADELQAQIDALPDELGIQNYPVGWYGCVAPPFEAFFVEARTVDPEHVPENVRYVQRGMFVQDISESARVGQAGALFRKKNIELPEEWAWCVTFMGFVHEVAVDGQEVLTPFGARGFVLLDRRGWMIEEKGFNYEGGVMMMDLRGSREYLGSAALGPKELATLVPMGFKTVSLLHERAEFEERRPSRQMRRLAKREKGMEQLVTYHLLKIKPGEPRRLYDIEGMPAGQSGRKVRQHVVRGHWRELASGRMTWVRSHTRGRPELGTAAKDYYVDLSKGEDDES